MLARRLARLLLVLLALSALAPLLLPGGSDAVEADSLQPIAQSPKLIALTFDDGPRRLTTTRLLDGLGERGVPATFFLIGKQIPDNEDLILRMEAEGHEIGLHSYDHTALSGLSAADFDAQVGREARQLQSLLGREDFLLRPPYGYTDEALLQRARFPIILWSVDPEDWGDQNAQREVRHIVDHAQDGAVILLHDIFPASVDAALEAVDLLHAQGYVFLTVSELFEARGIPLRPGVTYRQAPPTQAP